MDRFIEHFFSTEGFLPNGHVYMWEPFAFWLTVSADLLIALSYFAIPVALHQVYRRRRDLLYRPIYLLFAACILLCGLTHVFSVIGMWLPYYRVEGALKLLTGSVAAITAVGLWSLLPHALRLPSQRQLRESQREAERQRRLRVQEQESNLMKSRFVSTMSHEVRTPMHGVMMALELLEKEPLPEHQRDIVESGLDASRHLMHLLNDILALNKIEARQLELMPERIVLRNWLEEALATSRLQAQQQRIHLTVSVDADAPARFWADRTRLTQILLNLTSNALKFTPPGGEVHLRLSSEGKAPGDVVPLILSVKDTGPGIAPEEQEAIFEAFRQLRHSGVQHPGGTGLGLTIAQGLAERMGGSLTVDSRPGAGATFTARLQVQAEHPELAAPREEWVEPRAAVLGGKPLDGVSVLVIDDSETHLRLLQRLLRLAGAEVWVARTGAEGQACCNTRCCDAVIMDIELTDGSGFEFARALRATPSPCSNAVILGLSGYATPEYFQLAQEVGMEAYLTKPVAIQRLVNTLLQALGRLEA